jgi:NarL family two-component system response regulator LiaR
MAEGRRPLSVALVNDYELVLRGLEALLKPYADRVTVVELSTVPALESSPDVILLDTFARAEGQELELGNLRAHTGSKVVVYSWRASLRLVEDALAKGADGYVTKGMPADELVGALEAVAAGRQVVPDRGLHLDADRTGTWPGQDEGLTARESEVVALIAQGLSNREIAAQAFLSINSIKSHIRTAYRKMGVTRRSQAVVWALRHGFAPSTDAAASASAEADERRR